MSLPLNPTLSPYTGWTRDHWVRVFSEVTYGYVLAADKQGSYARALYPRDYRPMPDDVDAIESFARIASSWAAWLSNPKNPATLEFNGRAMNLEEILTRAFLDGTDKNNPYTYWGEIEDMDQRVVETADIALALWFSRERVFNRMTQAERDQIMEWLARVDDRETWYDNWILFPVLPMAVRLKLGYPVDEELLDARLDQIEAFYRGDGWYIDGPFAEFELYNAWMFGWHFMLWALIDGERRPEYSARLKNRERSFLAGFQHFFGANGSYTAWGRSIVYRFSAVACFVTGYMHGIAPMSPGAIRRILSGNLKYFVEHGAIDPEGHFLRQGYHGDFQPASEAYISPGSPCWACHAFAALAFDADDPLWTATEEPLPVERGDFYLPIPAPGFSLVGDQATGHVMMLNAGAGHVTENPLHNYVSKYGKFVYSTHFPFNVLPAPHSYAPDAMISLTREDKHFTHRNLNRAFGVAPGVSWSEYVVDVDDNPEIIRVAILMWGDVQIRVSYVLSSRRVRVLEAPGALGCEGAASVMRRSSRANGWEYAQAEGRALAIRRLVGYDDQRASAPFRNFSNINLAYPYAEQPLVQDSAPRLGTRSFATAVLLRPAEFDPAVELAGIEIDAVKDGSFRILLAPRHGSSAEQAFVSLADVLPTGIALDGVNVSGDAIRLVRLTEDRNALTAIGATAVQGICELDTRGTVHLRRAADGVSVTTNTGLVLDPAWSGRAFKSAHLRAHDGSWVDVFAECKGGQISQALVRAWSSRLERAFVEFKLA